MAKNPRKRHPTKEQSKETPSLRAKYDSLLARKGLSRNELASVGIVFATALIIRSVYFFINKHNNPLFYHPILDELFHHEWARDILEGNFWGDEVFFRAPLYPYVLAFLYKVSGSSIAFAVYIQHVVGSLSAALVYVLARRYFSPRVSFLSGMLSALYWPLVYFEGDLLFETFVVFLDLAVLITLSVAIKRRSPVFLFLSGALLGLSAITRPSILILIPVLPLVFHYSAARAGPRPNRRPWIRQTAWVVAGSLVFILPVMARNFVVGRDIVPIASQGGVNFYIGNNPQSNGSQAAVPGARADLYGTYQGAIELAEREAGRKLKPSEASNYYTKKALDFIVSSPGDAARLFIKKLYLFWAGIERSNDKYMQFFWERYGLGRIHLPGFWLVGPFALLGGVLLIRRWRETSLLYLFVLSYMAGVVVFFVNGRFRLPVAPVLIIFASYAFFHAYVALRSKSIDFLRIVLVLIVCVVIVDSDYIAFRGVRALDEAVSHFELANAYIQMGDKDAALAEFEEAHAIQEKYPTRSYAQIAGNVDYNIGAIYWEKGLYSRAIQALERMPNSDPRVLQSKGILADSYLKKGRYNDAIALYTRMLQLNPNDAPSRFGVGVAYRMAGDLDRSQQTLEEVLRKHSPPDGSVNLELARTLELKGDVEGAIRNYEIASASAPQRRDATLEIARLYKRKGDREKALEYLKRLQAAEPNDRTIEMEINALRRGP
jgi:tetratricopeptide (TPR) repeat protein